MNYDCGCKCHKKKERFCYQCIKFHVGKGVAGYEGK